MQLTASKCPFVLAFLLAVSIFQVSQTAIAQQPNQFGPADTSSPRDTLRSFIDTCNELHQIIQSAKYFNRSSSEHRPLSQKILDCIDMRDLPAFARDHRAGEVAVCLKEILDRVELPPYEEIPDTVEIEAAGGLEKLSQWRIPGTRITIARVEEGPQKHEYLFSRGTVDRAVEYYEDMKALPYRTSGTEVSPGFFRWYSSAPGHRSIGVIVDRFPDWTRNRLFGVALWKWPALLLTFFCATVLMIAAYWIQQSLANRWRHRNTFRYCLTLLFPIGAMLIPFAAMRIADNHLTVRGVPLYIIDFTSILVSLFASLVVVFAASNRIAETIVASPRINPQGLDAQLIRIVSKLLSMTVSVIIFLAGGQYLGIPLTTLLASAGIGGFAIALAAQDTLKNLFGTLMLMADKPFRVGERIVFKSYDGVIEDMGLRSTRIRLLTGHQATIPNDELARSDIENVGRRRHIRRVANLHIPLDTPREKIEKSIAIIRSALEGHEGMIPDFPPRVYFNEFNPDSFNIRIMYWYSPPDYWKFLDFSQKLNFEICRAFEEQGIQFSLPTRVTYWAKDSEQRPFEVKMVG